MTNEKTEIKYFFITEFRWRMPFIADKFGGHPFEGRVYRGVYDDRTKILKLVDDTNGHIRRMDFDTMCASGDNDPWHGKIDFLTTANACEFDITKEDLLKLEKWIDTNNSDLEQQPVQPREMTVNLPMVLPPADDEIEQGIIDTMSVMSSIHSTNRELFNAILKAANYMHKQDMKPNLPWSKQMGLMEYGKPINCKDAVMAIEAYLDKDKERSILVAIDALFTELQRIELEKNDE